MATTSERCHLLHWSMKFTRSRFLDDFEQIDCILIQYYSKKSIRRANSDFIFQKADAKSSIINVHICMLFHNWRYAKYYKYIDNHRLLSPRIYIDIFTKKNKYGFLWITNNLSWLQHNCVNESVHNFATELKRSDIAFEFNEKVQEICDRNASAQLIWRNLKIAL